MPARGGLPAGTSKSMKGPLLVLVALAAIQASAVMPQSRGPWDKLQLVSGGIRKGPGQAGGLSYPGAQAVVPETEALPSGFQKAATLRLKILDEHDQPVPARVQVFDHQAKAQPVRSASPTILIHPRFPALGVVASGQCEIELPAPRSLVRIERGTEYRPVEMELESPPGGTLERGVRLQRWIDMAARGWWSGDLHVHRAHSEMSALMEACDLHFAPTITRWNENSNMDAWPEQKVYRAGDRRAYSIDNCEDERGWGAALFFGVHSPLALYGLKTHRDYPPPLPIWREARQKGAFIDLEKAIWWGAPVVAALVPPDSVGVAVNHFLERGLLDNEAWGRPRDQQNYPGQRGFAAYIFDLYYHYLNSGLRVPASAGSANGVLMNPLGYNRSYVYLGRRFSYDDWLAGQKAGRNFVTNGPALFLKVNGRLAGAEFDRGGEVSVELEAVAAAELEKAEVIVDGKVVETVTPGRDPTRIRASRRIQVRTGGWLAARCFEKCAFTVRFAHTSPVYFGRSPARTREALEYMRGWIDAEIERIRGLASLTEAQREELLGLCRQAREFYR
jgi:hypothetical protein